MLSLYAFTMTCFEMGHVVPVDCEYTYLDYTCSVRTASHRSLPCHHSTNSRRPIFAHIAKLVVTAASRHHPPACWAYMCHTNIPRAKFIAFLAETWRKSQTRSESNLKLPNTITFSKLGLSFISSVFFMRLSIAAFHASRLATLQYVSSLHSIGIPVPSET